MAQHHRTGSPLCPQEANGLAHRRCCGADTVCEVILGNDHNAYARTNRGKVFAWGRGLGGQLGLGATERDHDVPRLMGVVQGRNVTDIFVTHDQGTWLSLSSATPVAGADDAQNGATAASVEDLEAGHTAGGGKTRNPLQLGDDTLGILRKAETSNI